jgi:hypothetical protein
MGVGVVFTARFPARSEEKTRELRVFSDGYLQYWDLKEDKMLWKELWSAAWSHFVPFEVNGNGFYCLCYQKRS